MVGVDHVTALCLGVSGGSGRESIGVSGWFGNVEYFVRAVSWSLVEDTSRATGGFLAVVGHCCCSSKQHRPLKVNSDLIIKTSQLQEVYYRSKIKSKYRRLH